MARKDREGEKTVASNRKARHDYTILETFETGIVLTGDDRDEAPDPRVGIGLLVEGGDGSEAVTGRD